ncbi:MAG: non-homologous end-joining DNA ligase [Bacilli bacterium]|nr:non-homologous end-joining DNA ligase [Bacilli bacterium]
MKLTKYNEKRDFNKTDEPKGKIRKTNQMRFVVQYHKARTNHYDFRLEYEGVLVSFALPKGIPTRINQKRLAIHVEDHPIDYLLFEGIIPQGNYGAGEVKVYDKGTYFPLNDFKNGLKEGLIKFCLLGEKYEGNYTLVNTKENNWIIFKMKEEKRIDFDNYTPQLATLTKSIPSKGDWLFEIKYDGYRMLAYKNNNKVIIKSRNNKDYTSKLKCIENSLIDLETRSFIVDGELVSFDKNGRSDFKLLQENLKTGNNLYYVVFDILMKDGEDLRSYSLLERKKILKEILKIKSNNLIYSNYVEDGKKSFIFAKENNLEGIIAKKKESKYEGNRNKDWLKIKCYLRQEFVIIGYTLSSSQTIKSLVLGYYDNNQIKYVGKVGTGLTSSFRKEFISSLNKHLSKKKIVDVKDNNIIFVNPFFICEVQYSELTKDNKLRQPSFLGLRKDKKVKEVKLEGKYENN